METKAQGYRAKWKSILQIAWPLIVANSFWNLQITIDRVYLGHYSTEALGAAIAVMGVFWTPMALLQQTAAYSMTFIAQYFGAKRFDRIGPVFWQSVYISLIGGTLFLGLIFLSGPLFTLIGHSETLMPLEITYFDALAWSAMPAALVAAASSFFTGLGNTRIIIWINFVGLVSNIFFDYLLIFGKFGIPPMGVAGAGYATALANWVSAIFGMYLVINKKHENEYKIFSLKGIDLDLLKRFLKFGLPSGMQWALEGLAFTVFLVVVGRMTNGDAALASSGIVLTVMMLAILPPLGVAQGVSVLVGQHLGEKRPDRAEEDTWSGLQVALMYIVVIALSFALFPEFYLSWFNNQENSPIWGDVMTIAPNLLLFVALFTCFDCMNLIFSFTLKGAGDTKYVSLVALALPWPFMVLPAWLMKDWENAIYWAWGAASFYIILQAIIFTIRFMRGKWKNMSVIS